MAIQIRRGMFETNSSSVHALCIYKEPTKHLPDFVSIRPGEFGWEAETYSSMSSKLSYVYEMCKYADEEWEYHAKKKAEGQELPYPNQAEANNLPYGQVDRFIKILEDLGIRVDFEPARAKHGWGDLVYSDTGYIDHGDEWFPILDKFLSDTDQLCRFLFRDESMIQTGNDNDDSCCDVGQVSYKDEDRYTILRK